MFLTTLLLAGSIAIQDPPKPSPAPRPEPAKPSAQIEPELRSALDAFGRASGYRFEVNVAEARTRADGLPEGLLVRGAFQRGKPAQLAAGKVEAFRSSDRLAWKASDQKEWKSMPAHAGELPDPSGPPRDADPAITARLLANLPLPEDVLRDFDSRIVSCTRIPGNDPKLGDPVTYECTILGVPVVREPARTGTNVTQPKADGHDDGKRCKLRITIKQGAVESFNLGHAAEAPGSTAGRTAAEPAPMTSCQFKVAEIGVAEVTVPEEASRILGSR